MLNQMPKELLLEQMNNGLILLALGMGVVFIFLTLLVFSTKFVSFVIRRFLPEPVAQNVRPSQTMATVSPRTADGEIAAAIVAAVAQSHRG
ncbi:MAG: OadG family protein [Sphaerochaetaceae bacterium]